MANDERLRGDALNIAIAKAQGWAQIAAWKCDKCYGDRIYDDRPGWLWSRGHWRYVTGEICRISPPDYAHSEDACAEAEKVLRAKGWRLNHEEHAESQEWFWVPPPLIGARSPVAEGTLDDPVRAWALLDALRAVKGTGR